MDIKKLNYALYDTARQHHRKLLEIGYDFKTTLIPDVVTKRLIILKDMDGPTAFNIGFTQIAYYLDITGKSEEDIADYIYDHYDYFAYHTHTDTNLRFAGLTFDDVEYGTQSKHIPF